MEDHLNAVTGTRHRFIDAVIDEFLYEMMEPRDIGGGDVHTGPAPDGFKAFQYLDIVRRVRSGGCLLGCHKTPKTQAAGGERKDASELAYEPLHFSRTEPEKRAKTAQKRA